ncbi:MAG: Uma2 family endonuclease [Anaerolineae bacterium]|nr:Uma2 family endonuclease [Anaerolineae bacterium]
MALPKSTYVTEEEYLAYEDSNEFRHEYAKGKIIVKEGSREHSLICTNLILCLSDHLSEQDCDMMVIQMRVHIPATGSYRYPDVVIVCDKPQYSDEKEYNLLNPIVLMEVLSEETEIIDHVEKLAEYRRIPSLQEYLLISQDAPRIERYLKQDEHNWLYTELTGLDQQLALPSIDCVLQFSDVFHRIDFDTPSDPSESPE